MVHAAHRCVFAVCQLTQSRQKCTLGAQPSQSTPEAPEGFAAHQRQAAEGDIARKVCGAVASSRGRPAQPGRRRSRASVVAAGCYDNAFRFLPFNALLQSRQYICPGTGGAGQR